MEGYCNRARASSGQVDRGKPWRRKHQCRHTRRPASHGVGNIRGPWLKTIDLSLQKEFYVTESKLFQLRLDAFNAFNNSIWTFSGGPAGGSFDQGQGTGATGQGSLGWITGTQSARQLQIAIKFLF